MRDSFVFYRSFFEAIRELPDADQKAAAYAAICAYALDGAEPQLGIPKAILAMARPSIDANDQKYQNGKKGGRPKTKAKPNNNQTVTKAEPDDNQTEPYVYVYESVDVSVSEEKRENAPPPPPEKPQTKALGQYGWVKLTDEQHARLLNDLGQAEAARCIAYVDEAAQGTGNKNGWRDWNLTVRKCNRQGWGLDRQQAPAAYQGKTPMGASGKIGDLERQAIEKMRKELVDG